MLNLLTSQQVIKLLAKYNIKIKRPLLTKWVQNGNFPQPIKISERKYYWSLESFNTFLSSKGLPALTTADIEKADTPNI